MNRCFPVLRMVRGLGWVLGVGLVVGGVCAAGQAVKYTQPVVVPTAQYPYSTTPTWAKSFVVGDLDGDGKPDLVYLYTGSDAYAGYVLDVPLFNNGGGTFQQPGANTGAEFVQGSVVVDVVAPVVKGGRDATILIQSLEGLARVLAVPYTAARVEDGLNARSSLPFTLSGTTATLTAAAAADLNGDGANDVVALDGPNGNLYLLINDGTGAFKPKTYITEPEACSQLLVDDFDLDGIPDIAVLGADGRIFVELSDGKGGTKGSRVYGIPGGYAYSMLYADIDGDGLKDLVVEGTSGVLYAVVAVAGIGPSESMGLGTIPLGTTAQEQLIQGGHLVAIADLNGDGKADIVTSTPAGVFVLLGKGRYAYEASLPYNAGPGRTSYALADFNEDGKLDLAVDSPEGIAILYGLGDGSFRTGNTFDTGQPALSMTLGDFRGKAVLDAAIATGTPLVQLMEGDGTGNFSMANFAGFLGATPTLWSHVVAGDFDGDGKLDVGMSLDGPVETDLGPCCAYPAIDNGLSVMYGDGTGNFGAPVAQGPTNSGAHYGMLSAADLNGDGVTDLVNYDANEAGGYYGAVGYRLGDTLNNIFGVWNDGYLRPYQQIATGYLTKGRTSAPDVVVESLGSSLSFSVQKNDGKGTFSLGQQVFALPAGVAVMRGGSSDLPPTGLYPSQLLLTDFDGDGNGDFLVLYHNLAADPTAPDASTANLLYIFWGNGDGTFVSTPEIVSLSRNYYEMQVADVNGDGKPDLVMSDGYLVSVLAGNGTREGFAKETHYLAGMGINAIAVASVTGPGSSDIVVANGGAVLSAGVVNRGLLASNGEVNTGGLTVLPGSAGSMTLGSVTGTVVAAPNPVEYDSGFTLTATLAAAAGGAVPTGTVTFSVGDTVECTAVAISGGAAVCTPTSAHYALLNAGTYAVTASYSGDDNYAATTLTGATPLTITQIPTDTTLIDLVTQIFYGEIIADVAIEQTSPEPDGGTLDFLINGTVTCVLPLPIQTGIDAPSCYKQKTGLQQPSGAPYPVGTYTVQSVYSGDTNYGASSTPIYTVVINPDPTATTVTTSGSPSTVGQTVTFTASIVDAYAVGQGTVNFFDNGVLIGSGTADAQGMATFSTSSLTIGSHPITACLVASLNYLASSPCGAVAQMVVAAVPPPPPPPPPVGSFVLTVTPAALSIGVGNTVTAQVTVTPVNGTGPAVTLGCAGLPKEMTCVFLQSTIAAGGGSTGMVVGPAAPHACGSSTPDFVAPNVKSGMAGFGLSLLTVFGITAEAAVGEGVGAGGDAVCSAVAGWMQHTLCRFWDGARNVHDYGHGDGGAGWTDDRCGVDPDGCGEGECAPLVQKIGDRVRRA